MCFNLCLTLASFSLQPPDEVLQLKDEDSNEPELVSYDNMVAYMQRTLQYCLVDGIRDQMDAFRGKLGKRQSLLIDTVVNAL